MRILAIDTATEACSAALWNDGTLSAHFEICPREHTQRILPLVQEVLTESGATLTELDRNLWGDAALFPMNNAFVHNYVIRMIDRVHAHGSLCLMQSHRRMPDGLSFSEPKPGGGFGPFGPGGPCSAARRSSSPAALQYPPG